MTERSIKVRSPCEINRRVVKYINPFRLAGISEGNALGSRLFSKFHAHFLDNLSALDIILRHILVADRS